MSSAVTVFLYRTQLSICAIFCHLFLQPVGMGVGSGRQRGPCLPFWIFIRDINIVDRDLKVLFFGLFVMFWSFFPFPPSHGRVKIVLFFGIFLLIFGLFSVTSLWKIFCRRPCLLVSDLEIRFEFFRTRCFFCTVQLQFVTSIVYTLYYPGAQPGFC